MDKKLKTQCPPRHWVYYTIEYQTESSGDKWYPISDKCFGLKEYEFGEHTACGRCWQITGEYGMFNKRYAIKFLKDLRKALTDNKESCLSLRQIKITRFRLVKIEKTFEKTWIDV